jgi:hypothetical protein
LFRQQGDTTWSLLKADGFDWTGDYAAPFDHTTFTKYGHYAVVTTGLGMVENSTAWLGSDYLRPTTLCQVTYYYHHQGDGAVQFTVYMQ